MTEAKIPNAHMIKTLKVIKSREHEFNMGNWGTKNACGTSMCFAGWAVTLAGDLPLWQQRDTYDPILKDYVPSGEFEFCRVIPKDKIPEGAKTRDDIDDDYEYDYGVSVEDRGAEVLGLTGTHPSTDNDGFNEPRDIDDYWVFYTEVSNADQLKIELEKIGYDFSDVDWGPE